MGSRSIGDDDDIDLETGEFGCEIGKLLRPSVRPPVLEGDIPTFHVAQLAQPLPEGIDDAQDFRAGRGEPEPRDAVNLRRLLRLGGERRDENAQGRDDEKFYGFHVSTRRRTACQMSPTPSRCAHTPMYRVSISGPDTRSM